jgi:diguanylate cyclase (GGDEF)-like protein
MKVPSSLDVFSVKTMALITVLAVSLMTLSAWKVNARIAGMRLFTVGLLCVSFGAIAGMARVVIAGNVMFIVCNVFFLSGMIAIVQSVRAFRGLHPLSRSLLTGFSALVSAGYFWWMFGHDNFGMRVGVISAALALLSLDAGVSMFRRVAPAERVFYWPTGIAFAFTSSYLVIRAAGAVSGAYGATLWTPVPVELASTICGNIAYIGCAFGMLLASNAQLRHETERLALIDPLTSLPNRRSFSQRLFDAEARALANNGKFGLIYMDLDHFKLVNDTQGHAAGDDFLKRVSAAIAGKLGPDDCVGRLGGDEFVALIAGVRSYDEVMAIAGQLKDAAESEPVVAGLGVSITVSCGVAMFPEDGTSAHDVMNEADMDMYRSRESSRAFSQPSRQIPEPGRLTFVEYGMKTKSAERRV